MNPHGNQDTVAKASVKKKTTKLCLVCCRTAVGYKYGNHTKLARQILQAQKIQSVKSTSNRVLVEIKRVAD